MFDDSRGFVTRAFLRSEFELEYRAYAAEHDAALLQRLIAWDARMQLSEVQAEGAFVQTFFEEVWGYGQAGRIDAGQVTAIPQFAVAGEGAGGGVGAADLALGWFRDRPDAPPRCCVSSRTSGPRSTPSRTARAQRAPRSSNA